MLCELDKAIIREIQEDIPLVSQPFLEIAHRLGISEEQLLQRIKFLQEKGYIRRFGAALRHREMGLKANPMIIMRVPEERIDEVGTKLASLDRVTHCYQRPMLPFLPYNLFVMIHAETKEECFVLAREMAELVGVGDYRLLFSEKELKKTSMRYFLEED
ncbi:MAG: Lrp/AsnC family transcriptional regulator [Clostridia bacterium]|nr:Lrp/AsnC family transcriptional regulator [Clostridia bacterium]